MKKSNSKLIIGIIIASIIVLIAIIGAYLYFTTDLFKGNRQLFFKYLAKNGEVVEAISLNNKLEENITKNKHKEEAEMTFNVESNDTQIANQSIPARNFSVKYLAKVDPENNKKSSETTLKYLSTDLFILKYIRNNDLYALKSDEVINKYLAFENNNLKEFAKKLGIEDTSAVPDKIQPIDFETLFSITKEQQKAILQKYIGVINEQISKDNYESEKDVAITVNGKNINANAYSLELNQDEIVSVINSFLNTLKEDDETLNILIEKIELIDSENTISLDYLKDILQNAIDGLNDIQIINEETIKITVYESNGELVRTEIISGNDIIYIDPERNDTDSRIVISFEKGNELIQNEDSNLNDTNNRLYGFNTGMEIKKIEIANQTQNSQNTNYVIVTFKTGEETIKVSTQSKTAIGDNIENNTVIQVNISDNTYITSKIKATKTLADDIEIEELTKENSATINSFTPQYINTLSQAIINRLQSLYKQKLELVNTQINTQDNDNNSNAQNSI